MAVPELWQQFEKAITAYTGLSPAAFFSAIALAFAVYYVISGLFSRPEPVRKRELVTEESVPLPPPVQIGEVSEEELRVYDGSDPKKPLLMAIKGQIYDVSQSRMFYGPGGPYALFAGKDASRALAKMSFEEKDLTGDISGLGPFEIEALQDWEYKFMSKYVKVGTIKKTVPVTDGSSSNPSETVDSVASANENSVRDYAVPDHVAEAEQGAHGAELRGDCPADDGAGLKEETPAGHLGEPKEHVPTDHGAELKDSPAAYVAEVKESGQATYATLSQEDQPADDILLLKDVHVGQEEKKG